ncbi:MAG TPA: hypothetical protein VHP30_01210 [Ignavibacteriales bacterium]|nr:hypothetical protein [Ignavibacteriales bacterium]
MKKLNVIIIGLIIIAAGCGTSRESALRESKPLFSIIYSESGGFTGQTVKWRLNSNGLVEKIETFPTGRDSVYESSVVDSSEIYGLRKKLDESKFMDMNYDYAGNITYSIILMDGKTKSATWGAREESSAPDNAKEIINQIRAYIKKN